MKQAIFAIKIKNVILPIIFCLGLLVFLYPYLSNFIYRYESSQIISTFEQDRLKIDSKEIEERINLAKSFNDSLHNVIAEDPYTKTKHREGRAEYARMLEIHENMGYVEIPKINQEIPMYAGTTEDVLQKGVGHLEGTSLPVGGKSTHTVLTAHTGLPKAQLFTDLDKLAIGDIFYIHNIYETLAYQVDQIKVVEPFDFSDLLIHSNEDYATLLTCTPYMINTHRLLVRGRRIPLDTRGSQTEHIQSNVWQNYIIYIILLIIVLIIIYLLFKRRKRKYTKNEN